MNVSYLAVTAMSVAAGAGFVGVGVGFDENVATRVQAEPIDNADGIGSTAIGTTILGAEGQANRCFGDHVVQVIAYPNEALAKAYVQQISPHAPNGIYYYRKANGQFVVRANAFDRNDANGLLSRLRQAGVPSDAFVRSRPSDDPCHASNANSTPTMPFGAILGAVIDVINPPPATGIVPSAAATPNPGAAHGELVAFSDAQLFAARRGARKRLAQLESGHVTFGPGTRDEIAKIIAMDAMWSSELRSRGHNAEGGIAASKQLQITSALVAEAYSHLGKPYVFNANGPNSFDCSGLTAYVYRDTLGVGMVDYSAAQMNSFPKKGMGERLPGDIIGRYPGEQAGRGGHVAIYIGGGQYIHAPAPGKSVSVSGNAGGTHLRTTVRPWSQNTHVPGHAQIHASSTADAGNVTKWFAGMGA